MGSYQIEHAILEVTYLETDGDKKSPFAAKSIQACNELAAFDVY